MAAFVRGLGLDAADLIPTRHYLLFAGTGSGRPAASGASAARTTRRRGQGPPFESRVSKAFIGGCAELVAVRSGRRIEPVLPPVHPTTARRATVPPIIPWLGSTDR